MSLLSSLERVSENLHSLQTRPGKNDYLYNRTATMVASEDTFVMSLHKKAFEEIMGAYL
jgi:CRP-like cAMP-binding protein